MKFSRYAIFYTPGPGPFSEFCSSWLGWDAETGQVPTPPDIADLPLPRDGITETPRKYGFHGTIKPPFRLAPGQSEAALQAALSAFCSGRGPVMQDGLELARLGRFLALVPTGNSDALNDLAGAALRGFDRFRAPLTEEDLARRRASHLTPRQNALLMRWGYPYVLGEFRFHLTLTGKMPKAGAEATRAALLPHLAPLLPAPFVIDSLSLAGEGPDGFFRVIRRCHLRGASSQA